MGGTQWTAAEENCFWNVMIPQTKHRQGGGGARAAGVKTWEQIAVLMQARFPQAQGNRKYTASSLNEHYYQNAVRECFSPNAGRHAAYYIQNEYRLYKTHPCKGARGKYRLRRSMFSKSPKRDKRRAAARDGTETGREGASKPGYEVVYPELNNRDRRLPFPANVPSGEDVYYLNGFTVGHSVPSAYPPMVDYNNAYDNNRDQTNRLDVGEPLRYWDESADTLVDAPTVLRDDNDAAVAAMNLANPSNVDLYGPDSDTASANGNVDAKGKGKAKAKDKGKGKAKANGIANRDGNGDSKKGPAETANIAGGITTSPSSSTGATGTQSSSAHGNLAAVSRKRKLDEEYDEELDDEEFEDEIANCPTEHLTEWNDF